MDIRVGDELLFNERSNPSWAGKVAIVTGIEGDSATLSLKGSIRTGSASLKSLASWYYCTLLPTQLEND